MADEFLIGAIGMMYNVRITVVSPYFSDVWNVFHDGHAQPDIVLVCNGAYFWKWSRQYYPLQWNTRKGQILAMCWHWPNS